MRLPFLRPKPASEPVRPAAPRAERGRGARGDAGEAEVAAARTRARRRLVGALVLLVVGVVGFPVLFETQPRPLPLDIPIRLPAGESRSPGPVAPPLPGRTQPVTSLPADAGSELPAAEPIASATARPAPGPVPAAATAASAPADAAPEARKSASVSPPPTSATPAVKASAPKEVAPKASAPAVLASPAPRAASAATRAASAATRPADGSRAAALLAGTAPASAAAAEGRFVVQVGAYTDLATLRATRAKVEKLGLKTYTQVIEGDAGKRTRVRVGPFATRADAAAVAAKLKGAGLPGNVLAL